MEPRTELGEFLRSRRARLRPEDVGLVSHGGRRRVPGLRREELSMLAGVSVAYYTRLEQGQTRGASDAVLDAIARVLQLTDDERTYLYNQARQRPRALRRPRPEQLRPAVRAMIEAFGRVPALVIDRRADVLAWNRLGHALLAGHLPFLAPRSERERPNLGRLVFLDPHMRDLYVDWRGKARDAVAYLRMSAARYPHDPRLTELIGTLTVLSPEFGGLWAAHPVRECAHSVREYRHPLVGSLHLRDELLWLPDDEGQRMVIYGPDADDSPTAAALALLADMTIEQAQADGPDAGAAAGTAGRRLLAT
ncbi:helix-turn-helix transcriptional regulator [Micromonospora sp. NPDC049101]|uniref:helix-turn-helix domain-containing protein n=1 Tax=unclassified Micromonospora TaxID=2617518 RepID=UPI003407AC0E